MKTILVIEDDISIRDNIVDLLKAHDFKVFFISDGSGGIKLAEEIKPDLIVCDIMMPYMDGYEVLEKLKQNEQTSCIPFIFLTSKSELKDIREGMMQGADDYIVKPFKNVELIRSINVRLKKYEAIKSIDGFSNKENNSQRLNYNERIFLKIRKIPQTIKIDEIKYINSDSQYSKIYLKNSCKLTVRKTLRDWESVLPENEFIRIHRSKMVNINYVKKIELRPQSGYALCIEEVDEPFFTSRGYAAKIRSRLL